MRFRLCSSFNNPLWNVTPANVVTAAMFCAQTIAPQITALAIADDGQVYSSGARCCIPHALDELEHCLRKWNALPIARRGFDALFPPRVAQ